MGLRWKPPKIFYGWWIVSAAFFIGLYAGGVIVYGFTAVFEPIADEFGWSYAQISLAASLRGLEMGLFAPLTGILVDRWGPRKLIFSGTLATALGLFLLSRTTSLAMFYGAFVLIAIGMSTCSTTVPLTAVANWFRKKIGTASGIAVSSFGFGGLLIPVIVRLIQLYHWRMTLAILALGTLLLLVPLSLVFRHKPEQYGYLPDGETENKIKLNGDLAPLQTDEVNIGIAQALKTRTFQHIALAFTYHSAVVSAVIVHVMPYLSSIGVSRSLSSLVAMAIPLTSIGGRFGLGWLGDRLNRKRLVTVAFAMISLGTLSFGYASNTSTWLLVSFFILFGIGYGGTTVLRPSLTREYFGRTSFGAVLGFMVGINMVGNFLGPLLAGWTFDNWGSYQNVQFVLAGLGVLAVIIAASTPGVGTMAQTTERK